MCWCAEYRQREGTARLIADAHAALRISADHMHVFTLDRPDLYARRTCIDPFHQVGIRDPRRAPQRNAISGSARDVPVH